MQPTFQKEILFVFDNENDMKNKEKELVVIGENSYNLCEGGKGGFGYLNDRSEQHYIRTKKGRNIANKTILEKYGVNNPMKIPEIKDKISKKLKERWIKENNMSLPSGVRSVPSLRLLLACPLVLQSQFVYITLS